MTSYSNTELLKNLLTATNPSKVRTILSAIGDRAELSPGHVFGTQRFRWEFYGGTDSNISSVNLASKPGRSITERVTNAIDAVLEKKMSQAAGVEPASPMEAAKSWFGRPPTTPDNGLFKWKEYSTNGYDHLVRVVLLPTTNNSQPTIDIIDNGIGLTPSEFPNTILSLHKGNKIKKRYLAGAFGQGGASTLAFSDYVLVVSRHINSPEVVGFTIIKLMRLPEAEGYKEDAYVYIAVQDESGNIVVPSCEWEGDLDPYVEVKTKKPLPLGTGTLVRHYGYRLDGLASSLQATPGNLYHLLNYTMFDPLLPFRIYDLRKEGSYKNEGVTGARNRLMNYTEGKTESEDAASDQETSGTTLRHHQPREWVSPIGDETPSIGVEYWVVFNREKTGDKVKLRPSSNRVYIDPAHPVIGTMNGQNQGEMTARILKDINRPMVAKHIVIHLDVTQVSKDVRGKLFTSTRENFKEGEVLNELVRVISSMLKDDATLYDIERELLENMLSKEVSETKNEVKKEITNLLRDAGFEGKDSGETHVASPTGDTTIESPTHRGRRPIHPREPLPTLPYPQVTKFEIVYPEGAFSVHKQDNQTVRLETDADFRYDREDKVAVRTEPPQLLEVASKSNLYGGRMHWRLRPTESSTAGDIGEVIATLTKPDGTQMTATVTFEILAPREEKAKKDKALIPAFDIIAVDPETQRETFENVWSVVGKDEDVAYKAVKTVNGLIIYYSTAFPPYREQLDKLKTQPALAVLFTQNYEIWIGYHAIIQNQQLPRVPGLFEIQEDALENVQEHERAVVAEMQVKQSMRMGELQNQALKQKAAD